MYASNSTPRIALATLQQIVTLLPGKRSSTSASLSYSGAHDFCPFRHYFWRRTPHGWVSGKLWQSSAHKGRGDRLLVLLLPSAQIQVSWETAMCSPSSSQCQWSLEEKAHMQKIWNPNDAQQSMIKLPRKSHRAHQVRKYQKSSDFRKIFLARGGRGFFSTFAWISHSGSYF